MEENVCCHDKYGYCKFGEQCRKHHFKEIFRSLSSCPNIQNCNKRHPRSCMRFTSESFCSFKNSCAYSHHEKPNLNNKNILGEMQPKMQNLEITHNVELDHLKNKMELLSKKVHMLEAKLNNNVKAPENLTSESVKEMRITANEEESEFKPNASSEIKDNVY